MCDTDPDSHDDDDRVMVGIRQEGADPYDDRLMMTTQTMITVVVIVMRAEVEDGMMSCAARCGSVCDTDPDSHDDDDRVMVGIRQEGADPDDDRLMMTTQTMITVVVIVMRSEAGDVMMSLAASWVGV